MGHGTFDHAAYTTFASSSAKKSVHDIYTSRAMDADLNPLGVKIRESRDSLDNPNSTPLIVAIDVTGSMGMIASVIAKQGLGTLFTGIFDRKPISDPHVMFMAIGDVEARDRAPLQASQFEADVRIIEQLTKIYLEGGGGGNSYESYHLAWYFAAMHTVHDSMEKRGKRGYLFTVGDEEVPAPLTREQIKLVCGDDVQVDMTAQQLLEMAQRYYDVYHIIVEEGNHARYHMDRVVTAWTNLMGQHAIRLSDHTKLAETIVSIIEVAEGRDAASSAAAWGGAASGVVLDAVKNLKASRGPKLLGADPA